MIEQARRLALLLALLTSLPALAAPLVPADFAVPTRVATPGFTLVPLGPALVTIDYAAYMSSIPHLQQSFTRSTDWPHAGITAAEAMADMDAEAARFAARTSFAYAVLTPDGLRERGCIYVSPSPVPGFDAVVRLWVTKAEYDAGFDAELAKFVEDWVKAKWPFQRVAFPGRSIPWAEWDARVAAAKPQ
ncbi:MAG: twin-arginine translocation pathway signal protein [Sphingomonadales bacterium]